MAAGAGRRNVCASLQFDIAHEVDDKRAHRLEEGVLDSGPTGGYSILLREPLRVPPLTLRLQAKSKAMV